MPDIAMCASDTCPARENCRRNPESGTVPNLYAQAWSLSTEEPCADYMPVRDDWQPPFKDFSGLRERIRAIAPGPSYADAITAAYGAQPEGQLWRDLVAVQTLLVGMDKLLAASTILEEALTVDDHLLREHARSTLRELLADHRIPLAVREPDPDRT